MLPGVNLFSSLGNCRDSTVQPGRTGLSQLLHPITYPHLSKHFTEISIITSVSPPTEAVKYAKPSPGSPTGNQSLSPQNCSISEAIAALWGTDSSFYLFLFGGVWGWGVVLLCNILQNSSSACNTCVFIQPLLNAVRKGHTHKRCQGMGKTLLSRSACSEE